MKYIGMLEDSYRHALEVDGDFGSRSAFICDHIFNITTYDDTVSHLLGQCGVDICRAITKRTTFELIRNSDAHYVQYIYMMNMPFFSDRIDWGGSIRGAWWDFSKDSITIESCGLFDGGGKQLEKLSFNEVEWHLFVDALYEFVTDEEEEE